MGKTCGMCGSSKQDPNPNNDIDDSRRRRQRLSRSANDKRKNPYRPRIQSAFSNCISDDNNQTIRYDQDEDSNSFILLDQTSSWNNGQVQKPSNVKKTVEFDEDNILSGRLQKQKLRGTTVANSTPKLEIQNKKSSQQMGKYSKQINLNNSANANCDVDNILSFISKRSKVDTYGLDPTEIEKTTPQLARRQRIIDQDIPVFQGNLAVPNSQYIAGFDQDQVGQTKYQQERDKKNDELSLDNLLEQSDSDYILGKTAIIKESSQLESVQSITKTTSETWEELDIKKLQLKSTKMFK